ncbi:MAG: hypothetical protein GWN64_07960 [Candidatus Thorarchaeota archaeon]|nr:hypothetical protein [Candidatus Thorarchaeota archaeon]
MTINRKENFGVEGFRIQRNNPDGTIPTYDRMLGLGGTIDVSGLTGAATENVVIKEDNGSVDDQVIDISGGTFADPTNATVDELVTALNAANALLGTPQNWTASKDSATNRLMFALTSGTATKVQLYGGLISFLGFGAYSGAAPTFTRIGLKIVQGFDTAKAIALPKNIKDKEEVENETGDGSLTSVIVNAIVKGITPALTCAKNDYELKQMVMGGVYDSANNEYEPPTIDEQEQKSAFHIEIFSPAYDQGSNLKTNIAGWEQLLIRTVTGYEGDIAKEVKTFSDIILNLDATEYTDENGDKLAAYQEKMLTLAEYEALDVLNV